ncbi:cytochrome P450 [Nonomuraea sp. NN258]|uniref:cytochrome P450 n=1 Tax=Nonomuraea antri TaxID=2730852 RepID=UPI00156A475A|nr:cytochrome P450 [Nonomuraea antri]NRQ35811.1 cytochrome P450 [Nonomuraea antri]
MTTTMTLPFDRPDPLSPPPAYARLREHGPVTRVGTPGGAEAWLVTSYEAVAAVLSDRRFGLAPPGAGHPGNETLFQDGEAHARLRRLVSKAFSPRAVKSLHQRVTRTAVALAAELARTGPAAESTRSDATAAPEPGPARSGVTAAPEPGPARSGVTAAPEPGPARSGVTAAPEPGPARSGATVHPEAGLARPGQAADPVAGLACSGAVADPVAGVARSGPVADLVAGLATPLSIIAISELLGVDIDDRDRFRALADSARGVDFVFGTEEDLVKAAESWEALTGYAATLVAAKRAAPGDDLLSSLISVRDADDGRLSDGELIAMTATIVSAGYLSARNATATAALRILAEERLDTVSGATPAELDAIVEEVLRLQSGLTGEPFPRFAQTDLDLAGTAIAAGDMVLVRLEAANRDPRHFPDPDEFLPGRQSSPSLAFGHGVHYCLGAALARIEVRAALGALAARLPGARLAGPAADVTWAHDGADSGPAALHITW